MKLSIVTTLYRSAARIDEFYLRAVAAAGAITPDLEIVFVNDGSPDDSVERAIALHRQDPRVVVVDLSRNFGHHKAMMVGLAQATGDLVFLIDSDLEEAPECLVDFHRRFSQGDCDVVFGVQAKRRGNWFDRIAGESFFLLTQAFSDERIPRNLTTLRLMTRDYVRALTRHRDREFMIGHLWGITGFRQVPVAVTKLPSDTTTYSLRRRIDMAVRYLTLTSTKLLFWVFYTGVAIFGLSVLVIAFYIARYLTAGIGVSGFASLIVSIWFLGGLTTLMLGVLGIYQANILAETKRRPYVVVRRIFRASRD